jgi:methionyl aminopeptidase
MIEMASNIGRNDYCWCKSGLKYKQCHAAFDEKIEFYKRNHAEVPSKEMIKTKEQLSGIRASSKINIAVLDYVSEHIVIGMTTEEIDRMVYQKTVELGGIPATLGYEGYPKSVCTSVNDQICHGIPSEQVVLKDGDIVNVDASTFYQGYYSDSSRMFCLGNVSEDNRRLVRVAKECVALGLEQVKPWSFLGDMSQAIQDHARQNGYSVVREIGGHGIGIEFHEDPWVSYVIGKGTGVLLAPGMVFTVEPMINKGNDKIRMDRKNGWTFYTADGECSAQWEVTIAVTEEGYEILTY